MIIKFEDYSSADKFYSVLGKNNIPATLDMLFDLAGTNDLKDSLHLIPETVVNSHPSNHERFAIQEDRDNFDYIVSAKDIADLSMVKYPKKRKLVEKFKESYPAYRVVVLDLNDAAVKQNILNTFNDWQLINDKKDHEVSIEQTAIKRLLDHAHHFPNLYALGIFDGDKLIAFNTFEKTHSGYGISSFQKANKNYAGIYAVLTHEMAKHLTELGTTHINFEQDLGIEGLRLSKSSWHPTHFLKKHSVRK